MIKRTRHWITKHNHLIQGWVWIGLGVPTVLWWKDSILWVAIMSIYANAESSFSAHEAQKSDSE